MGGLRLALAYLYSVAGDDPGVAAKSRNSFDGLWRLVAGIESMGSRTNAEGMRSALARTNYAQIRRMVRVPQSLQNEALIAQCQAAIQHRR